MFSLSHKTASVPLLPKSETQPKENCFPSNFQPKSCDRFSLVCVGSVNELLTVAKGVGSVVSPRPGWACAWVWGQSQPSTWVRMGQAAPQMESGTLMISYGGKSGSPSSVGKSPVPPGKPRRMAKRKPEDPSLVKVLPPDQVAILVKYLHFSAVDEVFSARPPGPCEDSIVHAAFRRCRAKCAVSSGCVTNTKASARVARRVNDE